MPSYKNVAAVKNLHLETHQRSNPKQRMTRVIAHFWPELYSKLCRDMIGNQKVIT